MKSKHVFSSAFLKKLILVIISIPLGAFIFTTVGLTIVHTMNDVPFSFENNGTDLTFQSSDKIWSGEEDLLKGKNFRSVVISFELYKIHCGKSDVLMVRTKDRKRPWNAAWWYDNYGAPKWKVPYAQASSFALTSNASCISVKPTLENMKLAEARADLFIDELQRTGHPE